MHVTLVSPDKHIDTITQFRIEICEKIEIATTGNNIKPLPYGIYLLGYGNDGEEPLSMFEFFFYDQAYQRHSDALYNQAADLSTFGSLNQLAHIRSMIIRQDKRNSRLFQYMCATMIWVIHKGGGLYLTGGTGEHNNDIRNLHINAGMEYLGNYTVNGSPQRLSIMDLAPKVERVSRMNRDKFMRLDWNLFETLRNMRGQSWSPTTQKET